MPVLTKINTNVIADDAVTSAKMPAGAVDADIGVGSVTASHIAANAVGSSEIADNAVLPANIAYLGDGAGNLSGTLTGEQLRFGTAFTLTDDLTVNGDVTLGKVGDDSTGQSLTQNTSANRTLTGTGTLRMGSSMSSVSGMTGVLGSDVTGGSGLSGGIKYASTWRLNTSPSATNDTDLNANWEEADTYSAGSIGSVMTQASGVFTFPATGIWYIGFNLWASTSGGARSNANSTINLTLNNSAYSTAAILYFSGFEGGAYGGGHTEYLFDVTDTTTHKCKFAFYSPSGNWDIVGNTGANTTAATFIRLGDAS